MNLTNLDYIELKKQLERSGFMRCTPFYYFSNFIINILVLFISFTIIFYFDNWYIVVLMSFPMAFVCMQFGYLGHDAGHRAISKDTFLNDLIGHLSHSILIGSSFTYWKFVHNKHHAEPNHPEMDPDTKEDNPFSLTTTKAKKRSGLAGIITRYQSYLIFPAFFLLIFTKRFKSWVHIISDKKLLFIDLFFVLVHILLFFGIVSYFIGFVKALALYIMISLQVGFYFGFCFSKSFFNIVFSFFSCSFST